MIIIVPFAHHHYPSIIPIPHKLIPIRINKHRHHPSLLIHDLPILLRIPTEPRQEGPSPLGIFDKPIGGSLINQHKIDCVLCRG